MPKRTSPYLTKAYFDQAFLAIRRKISPIHGEVASIRGEIAPIRREASAARGEVASIRGDIREFVKHFNDSQVVQNERADQVDSKLEAIMEMLATRKDVHNLIHQINTNGLPVDESSVFA